MEFELVGFDPERHKGHLFSGWLHGPTRRVVFVPRMMHFQAVMNDVDLYNMPEDYVGERFRFRPEQVRDLNPEGIYDLMFENDWVRFYTEHGPDGALVMEGSKRALASAKEFARLNGVAKDKLRLRERLAQDDLGEPLDPDMFP